MANKGWICLHREIQDNAIWQSSEPFDRRSAWIDMLLLANHEERKIILNSKMVTIQRGQFHTSIAKLATRWRWNRKKVARFLELLKSDSMIGYKSGTTNGTTITIVNYEKFQDRGSKVGTKDGTKVGTNIGQSVDINNNYNNFNNVEQSTTYTDGTTFTPKKGTGTKKDIKLTQFHNMETNKYDFDALEKYLLERDRP